VTIGQAADRFAHSQLRIGVNDARAAFGFRQHDGIGASGHDGVEVGIGKAGLKAVDADQQARARGGFYSVGDESRGALSSLGFARGRDRILQIHNDRVGAARHGLVELAAAVGRHEKQ
jgi:hypothetical protein